MGVCGIKTDITRLKSVERQAREAVQQRDRFLAILSHELRNTLGAMVNAATAIERMPAGHSQRSEAIAVIQRQALQMTRLLDDLLDIARITQNKIQLRRTSIDLLGLANEAVAVVRASFDARHINLQVARPAEAPVLEGDPARLQQMIVNLLNNAAKYTPVGGQVRLELERGPKEAIIRVRDSGIGIRSEMLDKVFDLFVQSDETLDRSSSGLGVGLTLVRSIAELHAVAFKPAATVRARGASLSSGCH